MFFLIFSRFRIPEGSSYSLHLDCDCPQSPHNLSSQQIFDHTHDVVDKSAYSAANFAPHFPPQGELVYQPPIVNPNFLTIRIMSNHCDFSPAKCTIFDHIKLLYQKLTPDLFVWGKQFCLLWVRFLSISRHYC